MEWLPIESAPRDGQPVLFSGLYRPFDVYGGGDKAVALFRWTTLKAVLPDDQQDYDWYSDDFRRAKDWNVDWTFWAAVGELPEPPQ